MPQYLTDQEISDYGPEFVDVMRRVAADTAAPLNDEINRLRQAMSFVQQETGNSFLQRMRQEIGRQVPNWAELNKDPRFIQWSAGVDPFSGRAARDMMQEAWNDGDGARVAAFFLRYLGRDPSPPTSNSPYLPSGVPGGRGEQNFYTPAQISKFYTDVAAGRWSDREELRRRLDADIQRAGSEGRITDNAGRPVSFVQK